MVDDTSTKEYVTLGFQEEEIRTIQNATQTIRNNTVNYCSKMNEEQENIADYEKILNSTTLSLKMFASSYYKNSIYLEPTDIDQIKNSLNNYANNIEKINDFKKELIDDLTEFQKQIKAKHVKRIVDLTKEKQICEKQIQVLDEEKNKLIRERLSKIVWPYDSKTKEYDNKILQLELKIQQHASKIESLQKMRPVANEKDILLYNLHLKEKFIKK